MKTRINIIIFGLFMLASTTMGMDATDALQPANNSQDSTNVRLKKEKDNGKKKYNVYIPEEKFAVVRYEKNGHPAIGMVNTALTDFKHKEVLRWYLSIIIDFKERANNGMPTNKELETIYKFEDYLAEHLTNDKTKPNALFVAKETYNGMCHLIYYVYDPEVAYTFLQKEILIKRFDREFEFIMERDPSWQQAEWLLDGVKDADK